MTFGYEFEKRGSVSRRGARLRGEGSGTATSIPGKEGKVVVTEWEVGIGRMGRRDRDSWRVREWRRWFGSMW